MGRSARLAFLLATLLALTACSMLQPQPAAVAGSAPERHQQHLASLAGVERFELAGRIGVQAEGRGFSGSTTWQHETAHDHIALFSPLGSQVATISRNANGVSLIDQNGKQHHAADAETLTQHILGWSLPMRGLADWALGRPSPGDIQFRQWDHLGRLTRLKQDGWDIDYSEYQETDGYQLPGKINLRSDKLNLRLIIKNWQVTAKGAVAARHE